MQCPFCSKEISDTALRCRYCLTDMPLESVEQRHQKLLLQHEKERLKKENEKLQELKLAAASCATLRDAFAALEGNVLAINAESPFELVYARLVAANADHFTILVPSCGFLRRFPYSSVLSLTSSLADSPIYLNGVEIAAIVQVLHMVAPQLVPVAPGTTSSTSQTIGLSVSASLPLGAIVGSLLDQ